MIVAAVAALALLGVSFLALRIAAFLPLVEECRCYACGSRAPVGTARCPSCRSPFDWTGR